MAVYGAAPKKDKELINDSQKDPLLLVWQGREKQTGAEVYSQAEKVLRIMKSSSGTRIISMYTAVIMLKKPMKRRNMRL